MAGIAHNDRVLAAEVRTLTLKEIVNCLNDKEYKKHPVEFYRQLILKLAGTVLPRINEHSGPDGEAMVIKISKEVSDKYETISPTSGNSEGYPSL